MSTAPPTSTTCAAERSSAAGTNKKKAAELVTTISVPALRKPALVHSPQVTEKKQQSTSSAAEEVSFVTASLSFDEEREGSRASAVTRSGEMSTEQNAPMQEVPFLATASTPNHVAAAAVVKERFHRTNEPFSPSSAPSGSKRRPTLPMDANAVSQPHSGQADNVHSNHRVNPLADTYDTQNMSPTGAGGLNGSPLKQSSSGTPQKDLSRVSHASSVRYVHDPYSTVCAQKVRTDQTTSALSPDAASQLRSTTPSSQRSPTTAVRYHTEAGVAAPVTKRVATPQSVRLAQEAAPEPNMAAFVRSFEKGSGGASSTGQRQCVTDECASAQSSVDEQGPEARKTTPPEVPLGVGATAGTECADTTGTEMMKAQRKRDDRRKKRKGKTSYLPDVPPPARMKYIPPPPPPMKLVVRGGLINFESFYSILRRWYERVLACEEGYLWRLNGVSCPRMEYYPHSFDQWMADIQHWWTTWMSHAAMERLLNRAPPPPPPAAPMGMDRGDGSMSAKGVACTLDKSGAPPAYDFHRNAAEPVHSCTSIPSRSVSASSAVSGAATAYAASYGSLGSAGGYNQNWPTSTQPMVYPSCSQMYVNTSGATTQMAYPGSNQVYMSNPNTGGQVPYAPAATNSHLYPNPHGSSAQMMYAASNKMYMNSPGSAVSQQSSYPGAPGQMSSLPLNTFTPSIAPPSPYVDVCGYGYAGAQANPNFYTSSNNSGSVHSTPHSAALAPSYAGGSAVPMMLGGQGAHPYTTTSGQFAPAAALAQSATMPMHRGMYMA